ncbi:MAG: D-glycero-beta-D-manno-heptose-7-phosphate kinase [Candidatus Magnetoovum sp. WYHC-5]|nr:D-glycero-beta-D-manno-heptose-7-phosphate kinase [Candidatus Magnetoovum sp. WYHC-5]
MNYKDILDNFKNKNILVVGDIILDHYILGKVERISPEAPVPIVDVQKEVYLLGGAGNVANNIATLGAKATIAGVVGIGHNAALLKTLLAQRQINTAGITAENRPTTVKTRVIAHSQQVVRFDREDKAPIGSDCFIKLTDYLKNNILNFDGIIISDYKKGVISQQLMEFILNITKQKGIFVAVDPKVGHFDYYKGVSLITPNKKEASEGANMLITDPPSLEQAGFSLIKNLQCDSVLITRGEEGMSLFHKDTVQHIPTVAMEVYDVTGAGDTVIAVYTLSHVCGASLYESAVIANHAAGIVVREVGTAVTKVDDLYCSLTKQKWPC